jgi:hypothetical protein
MDVPVGSVVELTSDNEPEGAQDGTTQSALVVTLLSEISLLKKVSSRIVDPSSKDP